MSEQRRANHAISSLDRSDPPQAARPDRDSPRQLHCVAHNVSAVATLTKVKSRFVYPRRHRMDFAEQEPLSGA
jgi:hypothetical protein